jgi:hypothetical protein
MTQTLEEKLKELDKICIAYQKHLRKELKNAIGFQKVGIRYGYSGNPSYNETGQQNPTIISIENQGSENINSLIRIAEKYNRVQELRDTLFGEGPMDAKQTNFKLLFRNPETVLIVSSHRDSFALLFLKNIAFTLASVAFGAGLLASRFEKNSFKFWKSHGEITMDALQEVIEPSRSCF